MALFEVVLTFADGRTELRLTDQPLQPGDRVVIGNREWVVVLERPALRPTVFAQYVCEPLDLKRGAAAAAQALEAALRARLEELARLDRPTTDA